MGAIVFPHVDLDVIVGKPTNTSVQKLKPQLYTNARSVASPRGGGTNGHLAIVMPAPAYLVQAAGVPFFIPVHPGAAPVHAVAATAAMIAETIRLYNQQIVEHTLYNRVSTELTSQILHAVDITWLRELENTDFGFADVTPVMIIEHLEDNYAVLTPEALEANRTSLSDAWNPDQPIENLWIKIFEIQCIATAGNAKISDVAAITLTLAMFEQSGLLAITTQQWPYVPLHSGLWPPSSPISPLPIQNASAKLRPMRLAIMASTLLMPSPPTNKQLTTRLTMPPLLPMPPPHLFSSRTCKVGVCIIAGPMD
jgi:hypothetical protein